MTYKEKKSLYESIMKEVAKTVKQHINEFSSDDVFKNERRVQNFFGLREKPTWFSEKSRAVNYAKSCNGPYVVMFLDENPENFWEGFYVMILADASRLERTAEDIFTYIH